MCLSSFALQCVDGVAMQIMKSLAQKCANLLLPAVHEEDALEHLQMEAITQGSCYVHRVSSLIVTTVLLRPQVAEGNA